MDVALLQVSQAGWAPPPVRPVRLGYLVTNGPGVACTGAGDPDVQATPSFRDVEQMSGSINPLTMFKAGLVAIAVSNPPKRVEDSRSPWAGMSGAAVFCRGLLTAVVMRDSGGFASSRLMAVPVAALVGDPVFRRLVQQATGEPVTLVPVELDGLLARADRVYVLSSIVARGRAGRRLPRPGQRVGCVEGLVC